MAFKLYYNDHYPLRLINCIKKYLDIGGTVCIGNSIVSQLSKLQVIDYFFPALFIQVLKETDKEAVYDYETCYIHAPIKQGVLSNWGSYKQKINNLEDCLLGNRRNDETYKNYTAAQNMLRRAATELVTEEKLFNETLSNLQRTYDRLSDGQKQQLNSWMEKTIGHCLEEKTIEICTSERTDGFSFEKNVYDALIRKLSFLADNHDYSGCWSWLCLGSLFGNYVGRLLSRINSAQSVLRPYSGKNICTLISSPSILINPLFCGRTEEMAKINDLYSAGNRVVFLYGISGIGKTEIAKRYAAYYREQYDVIIYAVYENSIKELVIANTPFETDPVILRQSSNGKPESDDDYFRRKLDIIKANATQRTLIILDNFNTENDECLSELINGRYRLLITTQYDYSRLYTSLKITEMQTMDDLKTLFANNYRGYAVSKDDPDLERLIKAVRCHTYTIILLAHHMENSGQTAAEMLEALDRKGILAIDESLPSEEGESDAAYQNLVRMFNVFTFSKEEQRILQLLSLMHLRSIPPMIFKEWADLPSTKAMVLLEQRGWILRNTDGINLHPVIQQVVQHVLPIHTLEIRPFLEHAAEALSDKNSWHYTKAEKELYCCIAKSIAADITLDENSLSFFMAAAVILGYSGHPKAAIRIDQQLYQYCCEKEGLQSYAAARSAFRTGWTYLFNPQLENALETAIHLMLSAREIFEAIPQDTIEKKSMYCAVLCNLSKAYLTLYKSSYRQDCLSEASKYAEQAVAFSRKWLSDNEAYKKQKSPAGSLLRLADIKIENKEYEAAEKLVNEAHAILCSLNPDYSTQDPDIISITSRKAIILYHLGKYNESLSYVEDNLDAYQEFYGEENPSVLSQLELKIKNCIQLHDKEAALKAKEEALNIAGKFYSANSAELQKLSSIL